MNLFNLIENTTGGYDNLRALLQAVSTRSPADLNIGGEPITLDYMEANFLNGIYRAYLKAGRQEEFIQDLGDARRFDMHMKKLRDLIAKQKSFRGSVPGQRGVTGDVPAGVMEGLEALEEIAMQDPNNPTDQNAGKLNWTRMIQDYMGNKPYTEFEFGTDRPLTLYRTQIFAILKAFGNMKPQQKLNIILNTFGNKVATVEYLDKLRAKGMMPKKVPAYVAPGTEAPAPGQMSLPGIDMPRIKESQKKSPQELARDTAVSAKVQRAFQLARARQPAAASDIEAFVKDEIERGEELAQQVGQLQQDNEQQSQQIAQLTKAVSQQAKAEPVPLPPAPSAPAARALTAPAKPEKEPTAKAEPEALPKDKEEPKTEPKAEPAPQTRPAPAKARKPRAKPRAKPQKAPGELPPVDTTIQMPPQQIPDQRPSAQILQFPGGKKDEVGAAMQGLDLGDLPRAAGQNESVRVTVRGNPLFEGKDGTVKQRIADDFFLVDVDGFGSHAFHVSKLVFEMQTRLDRFNIDRPMLPSGVAKVQYARDNNMYDDARIQEALPDKAMAVLKNLQQQQQQPEPVIDLNTPTGPRRGRPTNAQRAQRHEEFLTLRRRIALLDELIQMKEQIDRLFLKAQNVRGGIYPGLQADIEMEELYPVPETDRQFQDLRDKYTKDLSALQKFLAMKKAVYREDEDSMLGESTALVRLKQARQALSQQGVAEGLDKIDEANLNKTLGDNPELMKVLDIKKSQSGKFRIYTGKQTPTGKWATVGGAFDSEEDAKEWIKAQTKAAGRRTFIGATIGLGILGLLGAGAKSIFTSDGPADSPGTTATDRRPTTAKEAVADISSVVFDMRRQGISKEIALKTIKMSYNGVWRDIALVSVNEMYTTNAIANNMSKTTFQNFIWLQVSADYYRQTGKELKEYYQGVAEGWKTSTAIGAGLGGLVGGIPGAAVGALGGIAHNQWSNLIKKSKQQAELKKQQAELKRQQEDPEAKEFVEVYNKWMEYFYNLWDHQDRKLEASGISPGGVFRLYEIYKEKIEQDVWIASGPYKDRINTLKHYIADFKKKLENTEPEMPTESVSQDVAEAPTDYSKRRQRERDVDAGRPVKPLPKNPQTDYAKKRAKDRRDMELGEEQVCSECGGPAFSDLLLAEKQDACYNKVKSRYKVWPSAYASGALVQCRKKGADNWGNKKK